MPDRPAIVWFRCDLRLEDNAALATAAADGRPIIAVYLLDDGAPADRRAGGAGRWWLEGSLSALAASLGGHAVPLVLRRGPPEVEIADVISRTGAGSLHFSRHPTPWGERLEKAVAARARALGASVHRHRGFLLFEPEEMATAAGRPFKVFTPFARACLAAGVSRMPRPAPARIVPFAGSVPGDRLADWRLYETRLDWAGGFDDVWRPGEVGARDRLASFVERGLADYAAGRDRVDLEATSRLSPHLHFGEVSPLRCWHAVAEAMTRAAGRLARAGEKFLNELLWREFCWSLLARHPALHADPVRPAFSRMPWRCDETAIAAWRRGLTGIPIVDAGMRQLWTTGYMHNRARMIAASLLTKNLLVDWRQGERWFWDTLVDADAANNPAGWQWVAGSGADAAPWFRIFNPVLQGERFDPDGAYVRRFVPELAKLPASFIHRPWQAPGPMLAAAGLGTGAYPAPIVDLEASRRRALEAYRSIRHP